LASRRDDLANIRIGTFGGHHLSAFTSRAGTADILIWGVAQTGRWGIQDHRAHAFAAEGGFQPHASRNLLRWKPWLRMGYFESSGDGKPNDNVHETFFNLMPSPRPFARFPFFNLMNNRDIHGALISRPHSRVTISNEFHALRLSNVNDLWYIGGGVYQPWAFGYTGRSTGGERSRQPIRYAGGLPPESCRLRYRVFRLRPGLGGCADYLPQRKGRPAGVCGVELQVLISRMPRVFRCRRMLP
jgi:hypothetical protein